MLRILFLFVVQAAVLLFSFSGDSTIQHHHIIQQKFDKYL